MTDQTCTPAPFTAAPLAPTCTPAMTHAEIVAACLSAVNGRDPRIVAALDLIEAAGDAIDRAPTAAERTALALDVLDRVYVALSAPSPTVSQSAPVQAGPA
jgi:hypothetical protein